MAKKKNPAFEFKPVIDSKDLVCPVCKSHAVWKNGYQVYPGVPPLAYKMFWVCANGCDTRVGCVGDTDIPLGTLAGEKLRSLRSDIHKSMDVLWKTGGVDRSAVYRWMGSMLGVPPEKAHVGLLDVDAAEKVLEWITMGTFDEVVLARYDWVCKNLSYEFGKHYKVLSTLANNVEEYLELLDSMFGFYFQSSDVPINEQRFQHINNASREAVDDSLSNLRLPFVRYGVGPRNACLRTDKTSVMLLSVGIDKKDVAVEFHQTVLSLEQRFGALMKAAAMLAGSEASKGYKYIPVFGTTKLQDALCGVFAAGFWENVIVSKNKKVDYVRKVKNLGKGVIETNQASVSVSNKKLTLHSDALDGCNDSMVANMGLSLSVLSKLVQFDYQHLVEGFTASTVASDFQTPATVSAMIAKTASQLKEAKNKSKVKPLQVLPVKKLESTFSVDIENMSITQDLVDANPDMAWLLAQVKGDFKTLESLVKAGKTGNKGKQKSGPVQPVVPAEPEKLSDSGSRKFEFD